MVEEWVVMVEVNGFLGTGGELRLGFEPLFAHERWGSDPDGKLELMREIGFDGDSGEGSDESTAAALALGDRLTGVRITPELLDGGEFLSGRVPVPRGIPLARRPTRSMVLAHSPTA